MTVEHYPVRLTCPWCLAQHDCTTAVIGDQAPPENGNINICIRCEQISIYDTEVVGGLRMPTAVENADAMADEDVQRALWAMQRSHYLIKKGNN